MGCNSKSYHAEAVGDSLHDIHVFVCANHDNRDLFEVVIDNDRNEDILINIPSQEWIPAIIGIKAYDRNGAALSFPSELCPEEFWTRVFMMSSMRKRSDEQYSLGANSSVSIPFSVSDLMGGSGIDIGMIKQVQIRISIDMANEDNNYIYESPIIIYK